MQERYNVSMGKIESMDKKGYYIHLSAEYKLPILSLQQLNTINLILSRKYKINFYNDLFSAWSEVVKNSLAQRHTNTLTLRNKSLAYQPVSYPLPSTQQPWSTVVVHTRNSQPEMKQITSAPRFPLVRAGKRFCTCAAIAARNSQSSLLRG